MLVYYAYTSAALKVGARTAKLLPNRHVSALVSHSLSAVVLGAGGLFQDLFIDKQLTMACGQDCGSATSILIVHLFVTAAHDTVISGNMTHLQVDGYSAVCGRAFRILMAWMPTPFKCSNKH